MELGTPWENRALWEKLSPFNSVQNVNAAVLMMGGEVDWNVPIINSEQLYQALKSLGRTTELVVYPGEYHEFKRPRISRIASNGISIGTAIFERDYPRRTPAPTTDSAPEPTVAR